MNKAVKLFTTLGLAVSCVAIIGTNTKGASAEGNTYIVDFFNNYLRQDFELSNGFKARGNNVLYKSVTVAPNSVVSKPEVDPVRKNYEFQGWFKEEKCLNEWNFATDLVTGNLRLFAKWGISEAQVDPEPSYTPPSTVLDDSAATDYVIDSIMYFKVDAGVVKLPAAGISKLEASKENVLPLMEYRVKNGKTFTASYNEGVITINCNGSSYTINVQSDPNYTLSNTTYESKAKKYEEKAVEEESHHVMLAGSSSIEFWTSSKEDLNPVVSYNHGIGGTTIEEWDEKLNQRLVYPYRPKMVVYYVGINNVINTSQDANTIWNNLEKFLNDTHAALPDTKVQYIMMNLIPGFPKYYPTINFVNSKVTEYQATHQWLTLINPGLALLKENGEPNAAYFRTDGLHLSLYGYVVWGEIVKQSILAGLQAN